MTVTQLITILQAIADEGYADTRVLVRAPDDTGEHNEAQYEFGLLTVDNDVECVVEIATDGQVY